jgi:hypothetical protein
MRIMGFSKKWDKLSKAEFTTFRFTRKDRDWVVGERVQVVFKPRSPNREVMGEAEIVGKVKRRMSKHYDETGEVLVTNEEAETDGFVGTLDKPAYFHMWEFLWAYYGGERLIKEPMNKLTLRWACSLPVQ